MNSGNYNLLIILVSRGKLTYSILFIQIGKITNKCFGRFFCFYLQSFFKNRNYFKQYSDLQYLSENLFNQSFRHFLNLHFRKLDFFQVSSDSAYNSPDPKVKYSKMHFII